MRIEVTEKEAKELYTQRYLDKKRKGTLIVLVTSILITIVAWAVLNAYYGQWIGLAAILIMVPVMYLGRRRYVESLNYAKSQIEEQK